jgi:hypothetical protein
VTRPALARGSATFIAVIAAGLLSVHYVDRYFATVAIDDNLVSPDRPEVPAPSAQGACVDADGSWKNWPWPNVPMLSPKCGDR